MALAAEDLSVPALRSAGVEASPALFLAAMSACSRWQVLPHSPHLRTSAPQHLRTSAPPQVALRLLEGMRACELEPSTRAYNVAMGACVKGGNWAAALDTFDELPEPDVVRFRRARHRRTPSPHAIAALHRRTPPPHSTATLYRRAPPATPRPKPHPAPAAQVSYGTAINACARGQRWQTALALLGRMRRGREGPQPNEFVLSAAINACGAAGQWQEALKLLDDVQGVPPHQRVYNAAVAACDKGGQPEAAVRLLRRMRAAGVELDVFSYSSAMSACCRVPRAADGSVDASRGVAWRTALRLLRTMRGTGVRPNAYTYSSAMTACERGGCWEEALLLLGDMRTDRVVPNRVVYTAAIGACGSQGQWVQALCAPPALTLP